MAEGKKDLLCGLIVAAAAAAMFVPGMGTLALVDRDEPRFAEAARVMRATGDYVVPHFNGEVRYHKPPLVYWMMASAYGIFGVNEIGARAGSAVMGIISCVLIFVIAHSMFGRRAALISGIIGATVAQVFIVSRIATADALLLATLLTMFLGFWRIHKGQRTAASYLLLYGGLAAGSLTKGPVSIALLLVSVAIYAMLRRDYPPGARVLPKIRLWWSELRQAARELHLAIGVGSATVIFLAWFVPAVIRTDGGFLEHGLFSHVIERAFVRSFENHAGVPVVYYLLILPLFFFPWFAVLPESIRRLWKSTSDRGRRAFLIAWAAAPYLVFSFLRSKLPHYVLPSYAAFAIICGSALDRAISDGHNFWQNRLGKAGLIVFAATGVVLTAGVVGFWPYCGLPELVWKFAPAGGAMLLMTAWASTCFVRGNNSRATTVMAGLMAVAILAISTIALPALEKNYMYKNAAQDVGKLLTGDEAVCSDVREPSLVFYLQRRVNWACRPKELAEFLRENGRVICIAQRSLNETAKNAGATKIRDLRCFNMCRMKWEDVTLWRIERPQSARR